MNMKNFIKKWRICEDGVAAMEATFIFPILLTILLGTFDMGNAILADQKTIRASQIAADLITRERTITTSDLNEAIEASRLAFAPMSSKAYGVDIVSISFDDHSVPHIVWRETRNMTPNAKVLDEVSSLADANNGVLVVSVQYIFQPAFSGFILHTIPMQEVAFARGRKSAVINKA